MIHLGSLEVKTTTRSQNYGDFKSNLTLGERKPKRLTVVSTLLKRDASLVWLLREHTTTTMS